MPPLACRQWRRLNRQVLDSKSRSHALMMIRLGFQHCMVNQEMSDSY